MANSLSSKKRIRQNIKHRGRNRWRKTQVKEVIKAFDQAVSDGDTGKASEQLKLCYKRLDQSAAKGTFHKKTVARQKARLARRLDKLSS